MISSVCFVKTCSGQQVEMRAFTHPFNLKPIKIYKSLYDTAIYLEADDEMGWSVKITDKEGEFFKISFIDKDKLLNEAWIHIDDLGVVIQNYNNLMIPVFKAPNDNNEIVHYIEESITVNVCGFNEEFVCVVIQINKINLNLWVERKYVCDHPATTCY
ncbi:MAG: hypothetical protein ACXITV_00010 [Luteibaculaceae bacterium]